MIDAKKLESNIRLGVRKLYDAKKLQIEVQRIDSKDTEEKKESPVGRLESIVEEQLAEVDKAA